MPTILIDSENEHHHISFYVYAGRNNGGRVSDRSRKCSMHIIVEINHGLAVIAPQGRFLGDKDSDEFAETINRCIDQDNTRILIDLGALDYINSMGLGSLIAGFIKTKSAGGLLVFANGNARVNEMLQLTKTDTAIPVCASIAEAKTMLLVP